MTGPSSLCFTTANVGLFILHVTKLQQRIYATLHTVPVLPINPRSCVKSKWECHSKLTRYGATIPTMRCTYCVARFRSEGREHVFSAHLRQVRASLTYLCAATVADFHIGGRVRAQRACRKVLWNHCLCDESENVVKRKMNPVSEETVDCFIVNADLIDHIFTNLSKLRNQNGFSVDTEINWNDEYPKGC